MHLEALLGCGLLFASAAALAQAPSLSVGDKTEKISSHVWAVYGFPNIGIVVGSRSVLVVDTGLGPKNGAAVAKIVRRLAPGHKLYLTTTHFHPEHAAGEAGFPADAVLIRDRVQQREMDQHGQEVINIFSLRSEAQRQLLSGVKLRKPDVLFDSEYLLKLGGGVNVRVLWFGGAHTKGDELIFVEPDKTLISGDVVQNKVVPFIFGDGGTPSSWIEVLKKAKELKPRHVLPDHSKASDGGLVDQELAFIEDLRSRSLDLRGQGIGPDEAGEKLTAEFKQRYSDWPISSVAGFVKAVYGE